jgi:hypothetical protein
VRLAALLIISLALPSVVVSKEPTMQGSSRADPGNIKSLSLNLNGGLYREILDKSCGWFLLRVNIRDQRGRFGQIWR